MGLADAFESSIVDYSSDLERSDEDYLQRKKINDWLDKYARSNNVGDLTWTTAYINFNPQQKTKDNDKYKLKYTINSDYTIDVESNQCYIINWIEKVLPDYIQFNKVNSFYIANGNLTSLRGCPQMVEKDFDCHGQMIKNLVGGPTSVNGEYNCSGCKRLISLIGSPQLVGLKFNLGFCTKLRDPEFLPDAPLYNFCGVDYTRQTYVELIEDIKNNTL